MEKSIELSIIDLKSRGKKFVSAFEVLRNSLDFIGKTGTKTEKNRILDLFDLKSF